MDAEWRRYRIEQATAWLERVREAGMRVRTLEAEVADLRARAEGVGAVDYTRERVSMSRPTDRAARTAGLLFDAIDRACGELDEWIRERERARSCLERLSDGLGRAALVRHYLLCEPWRDVARALGVGERTVYLRRDEALCELYDLMPAPERDPRPPAV